MELPPETGDTFAENALRKAARRVGGDRHAGVADDSGIEAAALGGRPGVRSARYAGEDATDEENLAKLLREVPRDGDRAWRTSARSRTRTRRRRAARLHRGRCEGELPHEPRGDGGFGYDPAFVPDDLDDGRTMAELSIEEKDAISHRGRAARAFLEWLGERP